MKPIHAPARAADALHRLTATLQLAVSTRVAECVATLPDAHAELLALVWGDRFDREHAACLLDDVAADGDAARQIWWTLMHAADRFDRLHPSEQQRVRRLILADERRRARACVVR